MFEERTKYFAGSILSLVRAITLLQKSYSEFNAHLKTDLVKSSKIRLP